jgi:hypothetical protein
VHLLEPIKTAYFELSSLLYCLQGPSSDLYNARCTREIKSRFAMEKAAVNKKRFFFQQKFGITYKEEISKRLHLEHKFVWIKGA